VKHIDDDGRFLHLDGLFLLSLLHLLLRPYRELRVS
jgi:hypothetical protein